jgi:hypothetical protein
MANRKATAVLEATGSFAKNPQRRRVDPIASSEIQPPPSYFDESESAVWYELIESSPIGVLKNSDHSALEIASTLLSDYRKDRAGFNTARLNALQKALSCLGRTPVDRGRIVATETPPTQNDPWAELSTDE